MQVEQALRDTFKYELHDFLPIITHFLSNIFEYFGTNDKFVILEISNLPQIRQLHHQVHRLAIVFEQGKSSHNVRVSDPPPQLQLNIPQSIYFLKHLQRVNIRPLHLMLQIQLIVDLQSIGHFNILIDILANRFLYFAESAPAQLLIHKSECYPGSLNLLKTLLRILNHKLIVVKLLLVICLQLFSLHFTVIFRVRPL